MTPRIYDINDLLCYFLVFTTDRKVVYLTDKLDSLTFIVMIKIEILLMSAGYKSDIGDDLVN